MLHADGNPVQVFGLDDFTMLVGPDAAACRLEVGVVEAEGIEFIVHPWRPDPSPWRARCPDPPKRSSTTPTNWPNASRTMNPHPAASAQSRTIWSSESLAAADTELKEAYRRQPAEPALVQSARRLAAETAPAW
ncbi:MAG: hypothetical protein ACK5RL_06485 [Acidimicrobiales bacterium]